MRKMHILLLCKAFLMIGPNALLEAQEAKIINAGKIYSTYYFSAEDIRILENILGKEMAREVQTYSNEANWPEGIKLLSDRTAKRSKFSDYKAVKIAELPKGFTVLKIPASENKHMTDDMSPQRDIFFIIGSSGVEVKNTTNNDENQGTKKEREFRVISPGKLYSTYTMNETQIKQLARSAPASKIEEIKTYSQERTWPSGINTLSGWDRNKDKFKDYVLYYVGEFDDKYVLSVPPHANAHMPENMRPAREIYFIFDKIGVQEMPSQPANNPSPGAESGMESSRVRVFNYGSLMPFFSYKEPHYKDELGIDDSRLEILKTYGNQQGWPSGIATMQDRNRNNLEMMNYAVYLVGKIDGGRRVVLLCPAAQNQHMPADMRPSRDIFFALESGGVAFGDAVPLKAKAFATDGKPEIDRKGGEEQQKASDLCGQLEIFIRELGSDLKNLKGEACTRNDKFSILDPEFYCKINLEGADSTIIRCSKSNGSCSMQAYYGKFSDNAQAEKAYQKLNEKLTACRFECCTFRSRKFSNVMKTYTQFIPEKLIGNAGIPGNMVIETSITKLAEIDRNTFQTKDVWYVSLSLFRE